MTKIREIAVYTLLFLFIGMHFVLAQDISAPSTNPSPSKKIQTWGKGDPAQTAICLGPGTLQLYTYVCGSEGILGVENGVKRSRATYLMAYPDLKEKEIFQSRNNIDTKKIQDLNPDVVFISKAYSQAQIDQVREQISMPLIEISYGRQEVFGQETLDSIKQIGQVMGKESRARDLVTSIEKYKEEILDLVGQESPLEEVYIGGTSPVGAPSLFSSSNSLEAYDLLKFSNEQRDLSRRNFQRLNRKQLMDMAPEIVFVDTQVIETLKKDMKIHSKYYNKIPAFKDGRVYAIAPYRQDRASLETAILDTYYMGKVARKEAFSQVDLRDKARDIFQLFYKKDISEDLLKAHPEAFHEI